MKRSKFKELFCGYIINHRKKEIHKVSKLSIGCHIGLLKRAEYSTYTRTKRFIKQGYNLCPKCYHHGNNS